MHGMYIVHGNLETVCLPSIPCWIIAFSSPVTLITRFVYLSPRVSICSYLLSYAEPFIYEIDPFSSPQLCLSSLRSTSLFILSLFAPYSLVASFVLTTLR
jgi:hypothetical protein